MSHLISCPECNKQLQVPDDLIGKTVQCPECRHSFTAEAPDLEVITSATGKARSLPAVTRKPAAWDKKTNAQENDDDIDVDVKKRRRRDADDDEDNDRPSRRRRAVSYGVPHRGGMILAFGIIAVVCAVASFAVGVTFIITLVLGPIAWAMGNKDLREMKEGRMDPEGEGMTQTGRILGMVGTILTIVGLVLGCGIVVIYFIFIVLIFGAVAAGAAKNNNFPPQRR